MIKSHSLSGLCILLVLLIFSGIAFAYQPICPHNYAAQGGQVVGAEWEGSLVFDAGPQIGIYDNQLTRVLTAQEVQNSFFYRIEVWTKNAPPRIRTATMRVVWDPNIIKFSGGVSSRRGVFSNNDQNYNAVTNFTEGNMTIPLTGRTVYGLEVFLRNEQWSPYLNQQIGVQPSTANGMFASFSFGLAPGWEQHWTGETYIEVVQGSYTTTAIPSEEVITLGLQAEAAAGGFPHIRRIEVPFFPTCSAIKVMISNADNNGSKKFVKSVDPVENWRRPQKAT